MMENGRRMGRPRWLRCVRAVCVCGVWTCQNYAARWEWRTAACAAWWDVGEADSAVWPPDCGVGRLTGVSLGGVLVVRRV